MRNYVTRSILVMMALAMGLSCAYAERVTQEDAALVASNFMFVADSSSSQGAQAPARPMSIKRVAVAEDAQYYVYENANGGGWVMVAANDVAHPIVAYSESGTFRADNQPANVKSWLGHYSKEIEIAEQNGVKASEEVQSEWDALRKGVRKATASVVVSPLIKTTWDQDSPYWNDCPAKGSTQCYTGCVATAMAQVMNYWQWPVTGTGSNSLTYNGTTYTVDFTQGNYDWTNMVNHYTKYYNGGSSTVSVSTPTTAQKAAVAKLMYHCGVAVAMQYGTSAEGGSAAYTINWNSTSQKCAQNAFWKYFGYTQSDIKGYYRDGYSGYYSSWTEANWIQMLKNELDAARPIMYAGGDSKGESGHSFICDGYNSDNLFHFNWGWSGYCDGYYNVNTLVPNTNGSSGTGAGGGNGDYSYQQDVIIGIQRPVTGHQVVVNGTGCTITPSATHVDNGVALTATITPKDATYDFTSITVKLGSTTLTQTTHYTLSSDNKTLTVNASAISGDASNNLTITCVWTKNRYSYSLLGTNCTSNLEGMLSKNASLSLTITPDAGYTLADASCWMVEMGSTMLTYGTGFTYNSSTSTFYIASVTGDVTILAEAGRQITWRANGSVHATNLTASDKIILPTDPEDCSGSNGKKFVGWCTESNYSNASTAPTFAKEGDSYSVATYYAVYATQSGSGGTSSSTKYTFTSKSWDDEQNAWKSNKDGGQLTSGQGVQVTTTYSGAGAETKAAISNVSKVIVEYCTNSKQGAGSIAITVGSSSVSHDVSAPSSGGTTLRDMEFEFSNASGIVSIEVTCSTNSIYINSITITSGGGASYSDYSTVCGTPCSNTPSMSFANTTVSKTTADGTFTQAVTITGKGSGQTVAYSSSNEAVATVNASGAVTINSIGTTTITASVDANGTYCSASASYTLNVTAAPIDVTLYYGGTSATITGQTNPYTLPTTGTYVADMCDGEWTFDGWYGSAYAKSTEQPEYITQLSATGSAYAVYKTTETSEGGGGGSSTTKTMDSFSAISGNVDGDENVSYTAAKGGANTEPAVNSSQIRIYQNGGTLTVSANNGKKLTSVTIGSAMSTTVTYAVDGGSASSNQSISANGTLVVGDLDATSLLFTCKGTTSSTRLYLNYLSVTYSGGGGSTTTTTYYATTPECVTPCSNTLTMSFTDATVNKTTADASYTQAVTISGKGDGQTVAYSSSDVTVATVDNSGVVTLLGKVGSTTITASVEANGDYCAASASYTINVTVAPIDVTLYYNSTSATISNQTPLYTLPTTSPYNTAMCDGDWTFAGWYGSEYTKSTTAPTYITQLSATGSAYAVYTTTETVSSAPVRKTAAAVDDIMWSEDWTGVTNNTQPSSPSANGSTVYGSATITYSWTNGGTTTQTYTSGGPNNNENILVAKSNGAFTASGIPTGGATELTLTYATSGKGSITVSSSTENVSVSDNTISISDAGVTSFNLEFKNTSTGDNVRLDNIEVKVKTAGSGNGGTTTTTYYATTPDCAITCNLTSISLNTASAKKTFFVGETFSNAGVIVTANYSNCDSKTVNGFYTVPDMSSAGTKTVNISYTENGVTKEASYEITVVCELTSITLNTTSATTTFDVGDTFTSEGVVVTAHYKSNNCADQTVDGFYTVPSDMTTAGTKTVNVSYTENGVTKEATYDITVVQPVYYTVTWIACGDTIQTETYREGAHLVFPTSPGANAGKAFYGWTTTQHYTGTSAPPIISEGGEVHANATYYAVYE